MKRWFWGVLAVFSLFGCLGISAFGESYATPEISLPSDVSDRLGQLPEDAEQFYTWFDADSFFSLAEKSFGSSFAAALGCFFCLISVSAVASVMGALSESIENKGIVTAFEYMSVLSGALLSVSYLQNVFTGAADHLQTLAVFGAGVIPVYTGICTAAGMNGLSLASGSGLSLALAFVALISGGILMPLLRICFVIGFSAAVSDVAGIRQIAALVRRFFVGAVAAVAALLTAVFAFQTTISAKADSLAGRAFRYVASSALPLVGGALSEASKTLSSAFSLLGSVTGGVGVVSVLCLMLPVMVQLWLFRLGFLFAGAVSDILQLPRLSGLYRDAGALLGALMAVLALVGAVLLFEFAAMMRMG